MPFGDRRRDHLARPSAPTSARGRRVGILDGWLIDEGDAATVEGVEVRADPTADDRSEGDRRDGPQRTGTRRYPSRRAPMTTDHGAAAAVEILPVPGLPEFRPGDDVAAAIAAAAPWLRDDDVVVVTSKVLSKSEGRIVAAPTDPDERDALRRRLIDDEAVRVLARKGRTLDHRERHRADPGRRGRRRLQRRLRRTGPAASRSRRQRRALCATGSTSSSASPSAWWSPTRWAGRGATARPTPPSAPRASRCCTATPAPTTDTATNCSSPRSPSPTRSPQRPIW